MTLPFADIYDAQAYDSTVDTPAQQLCEGVLVQKDGTAVAKRQTGWQSKTQGLYLYSYIDRESELNKMYALAYCASTACIVRTYKDSFRVEYKTAD